MRNLIAGIVLFLISVIVSAASLPGGAYRDGNVLQKAMGMWDVDKNGNWMFCAFFLDESGLELESAKCWKVPYAVTGTKQARMR